MTACHPNQSHGTTRAAQARAKFQWGGRKCHAVRTRVLELSRSCPTHHILPLSLSAAASRSRSTPISSRRFISSAFKHVHSSLLRAQVVSAVSCDTLPAPAGAVWPAGAGFLFASSMVRGLSDASASKAGVVGASMALGRGRWAHQQGEQFCLVHALSFVPVQRGMQRGIALDFSMEAPIETQLPLLGRIDAPSVVPTVYVKRCKSFREAVRMCWQLRRVHYMTQRQLAIEAGLRPQLISDYLNPDDRDDRRDLPADRIAAFEAVCGNTLVSQWLAARSSLTVLEEMQAERAAA